MCRLRLSVIISALVFLGGFHAICANTPSGSTNSSNSYQVIFGWKVLDYKWPSPQARDKSLETTLYIPENNIVTGIKLLDDDRVFLAVPRQRPGVPSTLNVVKLNSNSNNNASSMMTSPPLEPYPSWEMQKIGNCSAFQFVHSMEIDEFGRMWVIDLGRVNIATSDVLNLCPPKLLIIDLKKDKIIKSYEFPPDVVSPSSNYLNDIVVGCMGGGKENCWAYITNPSEVKLVVYSLQQDRSWFVYHSTMLADPMATNIPILGRNYTFNISIDGIALSPKSSLHDRLYYTPVSSFSTYSVPTSVLRVAMNGMTLGNSDVTVHTTSRSSQTGGMVMDSEGILYYIQLRNNSIAYVNSTAPGGFLQERPLLQNDVDLQWPNTFAFDGKGYMYMTTNRMNRFLINELDWNEVNFRVVRVFTGTKNYSAQSDRV